MTRQPSRPPAPRPPSARTARRSRRRLRVLRRPARLDPATGELVEGGIEAQTERVMRNLDRRARRGRRRLRRRRQDARSSSPTSATSRRSTPSTPVHARPAAGPLDGRRGRAARRAPGSRSRPSHACRADGRSVDTPNGAPIPCRHPTDDIRPTRAGTAWRRERPPSSDPGPSAPLPVNPPEYRRRPGAVAVVLAAGLGTRMRSRSPRSSTRCAAGRCSPTSSTRASTADGHAGRARSSSTRRPRGHRDGLRRAGRLRAPGRAARDRRRRPGRARRGPRRRRPRSSSCPATCRS